MALGKIWNALFGRQAAAKKDLAILGAERSTSQGISTPTRSAVSAACVVPAASGLEIAGRRRETVPPTATKVKKKSLGKRTKKTVSVAKKIAVSPIVEAPPQRSVRVARPQKNAWTKLLSGRQIGSILDTNLGDASRAVEILQAIVCDAAPIPKYVAIDLFELTCGGLSVLEFHQRIRRVGGQALAIPAQLPAGLRQLSQTLGTVDLVLLDGDEIDLTQLELRRLLGRVTHSETLVLHRDSRGKWQTLNTVAPARQRVSEQRCKAA